jgi:hypothetical protein
MQAERMRHERVSMSEPAHRLLCTLASSDVSRPLPQFEADWEEIFQAIGRNGLLGLTYRYLNRHPDESYPPSEFRQNIQQATRLLALKTSIMYRRIGDLLARLHSSALDFLVVKGPAVAHTVYPEPSLRPFNDLDLVVRAKDFSKTHWLLRDFGFIQLAEGDGQVEISDLPPQLVGQSSIYEIQYWHPEHGLMVEVHLDDILNAGLVSRDVDGFWRRAMTVNIESVPVKVMSLEDQLIHLCMHLHYHGYTRLNAFTDIALIIRDHAEAFDWSQFLETVKIEEAEVGVYYTFSYMERLLDVSAPPEALAAVRPGWFRRWWHEFYMPTEKVLSLEPMWRPDFSFYFFPFLKRLLPDLLVMGRRREKLYYMFRLLTPPPGWLRHYYNLGNTEPVVIHYIMHPLKLLYHYLAEIVFSLKGDSYYPEKTVMTPALPSQTRDHAPG